MDAADRLPDEQACIKRAANDPREFAPLYDHYAPRVYKFFRYRADDIPTAEDLTAQTFAQALADIRRYKPSRGPFAAWLFGIANHAVSRHYRDAQRKPVAALDDIADPPSDAPPPEQVVIDGETNARLARAVAQLNDRERELIALKFAGGLPNKEIAHIAGLTESNVGVILYRAVQKLRGIMTAEEVNHDRA
jgi:RNA polymerase sigma-70 factor (ECF subfamily)